MCVCEGIRVHEHSGIGSKVYSRLGARCRTPLLVAHRCSCPGRSPAGNRRDTHTCTRHECWHIPRVGNAHLWRTRPHLQESRECLASWGLHAWQSLYTRQAHAPPLSLTYAGPVNPLEAGWTRSIWAIHSVGVPCAERRGRGRNRLADRQPSSFKERLRGKG